MYILLTVIIIFIPGSCKALDTRTFILFLSAIKDCVDCFHFEHQFKFQIPETQSNNSINPSNSCYSYDYDYLTTTGSTRV